MIKYFSTLLLLFFCSLHSFMYGTISVKRNVVLMGSQFEITVLAKDSIQANIYIDTAISEIARIENLISEWNPDTQISEVNRNAGVQPVKVSSEVFNLTKDAISFSRISKGAFDISIAAMDKIWKFDGSMEYMPNKDDIKKSIENVGYQNIILDSIYSTIFLKNKGMKIGFGSIGKAYAADKGKELLKQLSVEGGIINASGDMAIWGTPLDGELWKIGLTDPFQSYRTLKILKLQDKAVVTSGNYEKYVEFGGKRYSHIINPKTGYPASGLVSVTIVGPIAETANALSTSIMVLGEKDGRILLRKYPDYNAILISEKGKIIEINNKRKGQSTSLAKQSH